MSKNVAINAIREFLVQGECCPGFVNDGNHRLKFGLFTDFTTRDDDAVYIRPAYAAICTSDSEAERAAVKVAALHAKRMDNVGEVFPSGDNQALHLTAGCRNCSVHAFGYGAPPSGAPHRHCRGRSRRSLTTWKPHAREHAREDTR